LIEFTDGLAGSFWSVDRTLAAANPEVLSSNALRGAMNFILQPWQLPLVILGWVQRQQQAIIELQNGLIERPRLVPKRPILLAAQLFRRYQARWQLMPKPRTRVI